MNLQQRFLLFFADFRTLRDENTRQGDEILRLRAQLDEERIRFDALTDRYMGREEKLNDRMLDVRFGLGARREPVTTGNKPRPEPTTAQAWVAQKKNTFADDLRRRESELNSGPGQDTTH